MNKFFKKVQTDQSAIILVTVIMLILAMMTLALGLLSILSSQGVFGRYQIDRIKAEQLAKGIFWYHYIMRITPFIQADSLDENLDGKNFHVSVNGPVSGGGLSETDLYRIIVQF